MSVLAGMQGTIDGFWSCGGQPGTAQDALGNHVEVREDETVRLQIADGTRYWLGQRGRETIEGAAQYDHVDVLAGLLEQLT